MCVKFTDDDYNDVYFRVFKVTKKCIILFSLYPYSSVFFIIAEKRNISTKLSITKMTIILNTKKN